MKTTPACLMQQAKALQGFLVSTGFRRRQTYFYTTEILKFGKVTLKVMHTPDHATGSILLLDEKEAFTGDTLFAGSIGRVDLPGGSERGMRLSLKKLLRLPDQYVVYPRHGPTTTMGEEKRVNPFLQLP